MNNYQMSKRLTRTQHRPKSNCSLLHDTYSNFFLAGPVESSMAYRIGNDEKDRGQLAPDSKPSVKKYRTRFSPKQKLELENAFYRTPYPSATLRAQLANSLGVTPSVVMVRKLLSGMYMTRRRLSNRLLK